MGPALCPAGCWRIQPPADRALTTCCPPPRPGPAAQSTQALPFGTIVIILLLWGLVTIPLTIVGGILGKNTRTEFSAPCRTNKYPR